jgi:hypothetical protein
MAVRLLVAAMHVVANFGYLSQHHLLLYLTATPHTIRLNHLASQNTPNLYYAIVLPLLKRSTSPRRLSRLLGVHDAKDVHHTACNQNFPFQAYSSSRLQSLLPTQVAINSHA